MRTEDAQVTPTQSHISPRILVYEDSTSIRRYDMDDGVGVRGSAPACYTKAVSRLRSHIPPLIWYRTECDSIVGDVGDAVGVRFLNETYGV